MWFGMTQIIKFVNLNSITKHTNLAKKIISLLIIWHWCFIRSVFHVKQYYLYLLLLSTVILFWNSILLYVVPPHSLLEIFCWNAHQLKSVQLQGTENWEESLLLCFTEVKICMFRWKAELPHQTQSSCSSLFLPMWAALCMDYTHQQSL